MIAFAFIFDTKEINICMCTYSVQHDVGMKMLQPKLCVHQADRLDRLSTLTFGGHSGSSNSGIYCTYSMLACKGKNMYVFVLYTNEYILFSCITSNFKTNSTEILKSALCCIKFMCKFR